MTSAVNELLEKLIRPARVLLVEDDPEAGGAFAAWLTNYYVCDLLWVKRGEDAEKAIETTTAPFDIIFLDLILPDVSGVDVLRAIKKKMPDVPVVIVTGAAGSSLAGEAATLGVVGLFSKPFSGDALRNVFRVYKIKARDRFDDAYFQAARSVC